MSRPFAPGRAPSILCERDGVVMRGQDDDELVATVERHVAEAHPDLVGKFSASDIIASATEAEPAGGGYRLQGTLLEACTCDVLCPCWIGEDPDGGSCQSIMAYHLDRGTIDGVDVDGLTLAAVVFIPGNVLAGNWKQAVFVDDRASDGQEQALLAAFGGALGGPLGDLAQLVGERVAVTRAPISHEIVEGKGTIRVGGDAAVAEMEPYRGPDGSVTTLNNSIFSTVPGSPASVGKSSRFAVNLPEQGWTFQVEGRNAIQSDWAIDYRGDGA